MVTDKNGITTTTIVTHRVRFDLSDEPVIESWAGFTHTGKRVKPEQMVFVIETVVGGEPIVGRLHIVGIVLRKDGTLGQQRADVDIWGVWMDPDWADRYPESARAYGHLVERAREVAQKVVGR